ncbi:MAG: thiol-disulfide isomerase [Acidobacteria bacterium]|nr:thiol-disulfide isomerase [Acidobacteriota bacterium]
MRLFTRTTVLAATVVVWVSPLLAAATPTFHKDVLPILRRHCQQCHRAGEAAPMAFITYDQVRPWAKAIKQSVVSKRMPPWFAEAGTGQFQHERRLTPVELATLAAWADGGAAAGNPKDAPAPAKFASGWTIGQPDLVIEMPQAVEVPAAGTGESTYVIIPTGFKEDRWVQRAEVRPGDRAVTHHVIAFLRPPGSKWLAAHEPGVPFVLQRRGGDGGGYVGGATELLAVYAPGRPAAILPEGQAKLVKAGTDIVLQLHYTSNGKPALDRSQLGLVFAKGAPPQRVMTLQATNARFVIPPQADHHRVDAEITLDQDTTLVSMMPHMHLRGRDFEYRAIYPTGETETLLRVSRYDFNWQLHYYVAGIKRLPKGTRIECTAHFDNSANNPANPDPKAEVRWGEQSFEEMMIGWFDVAFPTSLDPVKVLRPEKKAASYPKGR